MYRPPWVFSSLLFFMEVLNSDIYLLNVLFYLWLYLCRSFSSLSLFLPIVLLYVHFFFICPNLSYVFYLFYPLPLGYLCINLFSLFTTLLFIQLYNNFFLCKKFTFYWTIKWNFSLLLMVLFNGVLVTVTLHRIMSLILNLNFFLKKSVRPFR